MRTLKDEDIVRLMREEWRAGIAALNEQIDMVMDAPVDKAGKGGAEPVLAPELKVRHKKSQIRYTVSSVGRDDVILRTPEGEDFLVSKETFEDEYQLD
jgi:hypothetical protein